MVLGTLITSTLEGTLLVTGQVTGFEYETLPGLTVSVENATTGDSSTTTVAQDGGYSIDLGDTAQYPSGYSTGDEIVISATHEDTTRTWTRRLAGSSLEQDVHFTHGTGLGALRKGKLLETVFFTSTTGFTITFGDTQTRDVVAVKKNGTLLDEDTWTLSLPRTLTLTTALISGDVLEVQRTIQRSLTDAETAVVREGDAEVRNGISRYFTAPLPERVPELQDISESLAAAALRDELYSGGDRVDQEATRLREHARMKLKELATGKRGLTDAYTGQFVTPNAQSSTTPQSNQSSVTRKFDRWSETKRELF